MILRTPICGLRSILSDGCYAEMAGRYCIVRISVTSNDRVRDKMLIFLVVIFVFNVSPDVQPLRANFSSNSDSS